MEHSVNRKAKNITIVKQINPDTGEIVNEFYSTRKAANAIGIPSAFSNIAKACKNGKIYYGFKWEYEKLGE